MERETDGPGDGSKLKIGTCSWKYPSWEGLVYSSAEPENYLAEYAGKFETVEIDQWFWSLFEDAPVAMPRDITVREYDASVPPGFQFTVKVPNSITLTHYYGAKGKAAPKTGEENPKPNPYFLSEPLYRGFLGKLEPLKAKIGMLMFQFEYLSKEKMSGEEELIERLEAFFDAVPSGFPAAIELRNKSYLSNRYFEFLADNGLSHVFLQGYYMPPVTEVYRKFGRFIDGRTVIRLHGYDREQMEKLSGNRWDRILSPKDDELDGVASMIRDLLSREVQVFVNVNNHYEGSAPLTIRRLYERLSDL